MLLAVGEHVLGPLEEREIRLSTGFAGGIGSTHREICGAVSAGVMIIGGRLGRSAPGVDDTACQELTARYIRQFQDRFNTLNCGELRREDYGSQGAEPCSVLVERASRLLLDCIAELENDQAA
ncbi:MAG: C-GCAxxG-C-C family protein [Anaerolineales bacterium]|nr:C-GCAxxG-C-C family protein [Anaerolineales bacterium]